MLIPKNVFPLSVVCDTTANRYALGSVSLERRDGKPTAIATDGKMLVATTWSEDDSDNYPGSFDRAIVDDFDTLIPKKDWEAAGKDIPNNKTELKRKPILRNAFLQEPGANGIVKMGAANKVSEVTTTEGRFPKWRDVMPAYAPHECVEYHCNADMLATICSIVAKSNPGQEDHKIVLSVPMDPGRPLLARSVDEVDVTAVLMPITNEDAPNLRKTRENFIRLVENLGHDKLIDLVVNHVSLSVLNVMARTL